MPAMRTGAPNATRRKLGKGVPGAAEGESEECARVPLADVTGGTTARGVNGLTIRGRPKAAFPGEGRPAAPLP